MIHTTKIRIELAKKAVGTYDDLVQYWSSHRMHGREQTPEYIGSQLVHCRERLNHWTKYHAKQKRILQVKRKDLEGKKA